MPNGKVSRVPRRLGAGACLRRAFDLDDDLDETLADDLDVPGLDGDLEAPGLDGDLEVLGLDGDLDASDLDGNLAGEPADTPDAGPDRSESLSLSLCMRIASGKDSLSPLSGTGLRRFMVLDLPNQTPAPGGSTAKPLSYGTVRRYRPMRYLIKAYGITYNPQNRRSVLTCFPDSILSHASTAPWESSAHPIETWA